MIRSIHLFVLPLLKSHLLFSLLFLFILLASIAILLSSSALATFFNSDDLVVRKGYRHGFDLPSKSGYTRKFDAAIKMAVLFNQTEGLLIEVNLHIPAFLLHVPHDGLFAMSAYLFDRISGLVVFVVAKFDLEVFVGDDFEVYLWLKIIRIDMNPLTIVIATLCRWLQPRTLVLKLILVLLSIVAHLRVIVVLLCWCWFTLLHLWFALLVAHIRILHGESVQVTTSTRLHLPVSVSLGSRNPWLVPRLLLAGARPIITI